MSTDSNNDHHSHFALTEENDIHQDDSIDEINLFHVEDDSTQHNNSTFLNDIFRNFSIDMQKQIFGIFDKIVELRWTENVPESTFARILDGILEEIFTTISTNLTPKITEMCTMVHQFASSLHLQKVYIQTLGTYIEPESMQINDNLTIQYVPISKVAKQALNSSVISQIIREQADDFSYQFDNYSSELTCDHQRWLRLKGKLRVELYMDEFTIVNPIGAHKHEHKYFVAYCSFSNIPPKSRMKRNDIYLLLVANHKTVTTEVLHQILDRLNAELICLSTNGIDVHNMTSGKLINIKGVLAHIVADNLSHYQLVGASMNFSLYYHCRLCGANKDEIQFSHLVQKRSFGTEQDLESYWATVERANGIELPSNEFNFKRTFKFANKEENIHPWNCLMFDLTHDICEGVIPKMSSFVLMHLGKMYGISKPTIVAFVNQFQFYDCKFIISPVTNGFKIGGDAVQVRFLIFAF